MRPMPATSMLTRLGAGDRALFRKLALPGATHVRVRTVAIVLTHMGGATGSIVAALWPLFAGPDWQNLGRHALATLVLSHLLVQLLKRTVGRPRPSLGAGVAALIAEPDRFSFPSGHAAAALAVALAYAVAMPSLAVPILALAMIVGTTRVVLGVHYPGDVAAGQVIAYVTHLVLLRAGL
jgi:undecaprenyl-diphosphatase